MNIEEYINTIYQQIIEELAKGHEHLHLCKFRGVIAVRDCKHTFELHKIIHTFTADEIKSGFTSKSWESIKKEIAYAETEGMMKSG